MVDLEELMRMSEELEVLDERLRKTMAIDSDVNNPAEVIAKLARLARAASGVSQAIALIMSHDVRMSRMTG